MGYKIKDVKSITMYKEHWPIYYFDEVDPTFELIGDEKVDIKYNNKRILYNFKYGEYNFKLDATIEILT